MSQTALKTKMFNIRTTEENYNTVSNLAKFEGKNVSDFVLDAIYEKIEDWEDLQAIREYEKLKESGAEIKTYTLEEVAREHGIDL